MKDQFQILDWDSNFFDFKIARIEQDGFSQNNSIDYCLKKMVEANVDLAYYNSSKPLKEKESKYFDFFLVNKKVPVKKNLDIREPIHEKISFYDKPEPNEELYNLVQRAGEVSKFMKDPIIEPEKVKELYRTWMFNSVKKKIASEVLVYKNNNEIKGFITLRINPPYGEAPLLAVDRKYEGKGVSIALLRAADTVFFDKGCEFYTSATQAENRAMIMVLKRRGFEIKPIEYTYHLWKK